MYSLPITTYIDYWRKMKNWTAYLGGTVMLLAGTNVSSRVMGNSEQWLPGINSASPLRINLEEKLKMPEKPKTVACIIGNTAQSEQNAVASNEEIKTDFRLEDVEMPIPVQYEESKQLPPGISKVEVQGEKGLLRKIIKLTTVHGKTSEEVIYEFQVNAPKKKVIIRNSSNPNPNPIPSRGESFDLNRISVNRSLLVEATAYTYTGNKTVTGVAPREGLIAVDPKVIPLGSRVYLEGYGYAIAADTGGAINGNRVDVFFSNLRKCVNWGRRSVHLYVLNTK